MAELIYNLGGIGAMQRELEARSPQREVGRKGQASLCQPTSRAMRPTSPSAALDLGAFLVWGPAQDLPWLDRASVAVGPAPTVQPLAEGLPLEQLK